MTRLVKRIIAAGLFTLSGASTISGVILLIEFYPYMESSQIISIIWCFVFSLTALIMAIIVTILANRTVDEPKPAIDKPKKTKVNLSFYSKFSDESKTDSNNESVTENKKSTRVSSNDDEDEWIKYDMMDEDDGF